MKKEIKKSREPCRLPWSGEDIHSSCSLAKT
jgi:hypothetical protein